MDIERTRPIHNVTPLQSVDTASSTAAPKTKAVAASATADSTTQVSLSDAQSRLKQGGQDIDSAKVDRIKEAIRDGSLQMDSGKIADALIAQASSLLAD